MGRLQCELGDVTSGLGCAREAVRIGRENIGRNAPASISALVTANELLLQFDDKKEEALHGMSEAAKAVVEDPKASR